MSGRPRRPAGRRPEPFAVVLGLIGAFLLAGCTGTPSASPTSTFSATPSTPAVSATATATPPTAPEQTPTARSAEAFVRYFWAVHNYAYATFDTEPLRQASDSACTFCTKTINDISELQQSGTRVSGSAVSLIVAAAPPTKITTGIIVTTVISQAPGTATRTDGTVVRSAGMAKVRSYVGLNWTGDHWLIDDVAIEKESSK